MIFGTRLKYIKDIYFLIGMFLISSIYNIWWYHNNSLPPTWDDAHHLTSSLIYYDILIHPNTDMINRLIHVDAYYPPFFKLSTALLYIVFGTSTTTALITNIIYIGILILSIYGIGKIFFDTETGVLASVLILLYPMIFNLQKLYYLDLGLTSMVTLSIYLLLLTDKFRNFRYSIYFGIIFGLAMLTKWTAVIFIIPVFIYNIYDRFLARSEDKYMNRHYYITSLIITGIISSIWYIPNGLGVYNTIKKMDNEWAVRGGIDPNVLSLKSISFYPIAITSIISIFFAAIFFIGLMYIIINIKRENKDKIKGIIYLFLWIIIPTLILMIEPNKNIRYILPIVGAIAIVSTYWVVNIKDKKIKYIIIAGILIIGTMQVIEIAAQNPPKKEDWKHNSVLNEIKKDIRNGTVVKQHIMVMPGSHRYINGEAFEYFSTKNNMRYHIVNGAYIGIGNFKKSLLGMNYVVIKTGDLPKAYIDITKPEYDFFMNNVRYFDNMFESELPDNTSIILYKRNLSIN